MTALENKIIKANKAYREGNPIMTDEEYDKLIEMLKEKNPDSEIFTKGILESGGEEELPLPMFSLEKVKSEKDIRRWLSQFSSEEEIVIMPKYDGISILVDAVERKAWTRGDGVKGFQKKDRFFHLNHAHINISSRYIWGEAIMRKTVFEKYSDSYKTARNLVAGVFNSDTFDYKVVQDIDFCPYGSDKDVDKGELLRELSQKRPYLYSTLIAIKDLPENIEEFFTELFYSFGQIFNIDGLVLEVNSKELRKKMGRMPNGNPYYSIAIKLPQWQETKETPVRSIEWNVGKDGALTPVILINSVELSGATVNRVSGHNAKYIKDNKIGEGAVIKVKRSGEVIPKHEETVTPGTVILPHVCPICGSKTSYDEPELTCTNENCRGKVISELVYFFRTMGIEEMGEPTIVKLYEKGYQTVESILAAPVEDFPGQAKYELLHKQVSNLGTLPLARILTAYNVFKGTLGEKVCQTIFNELGDELIDDLMECNYKRRGVNTIIFNKILDVNGVGSKVALAFINGFLSLDLKNCPFDYIILDEKKDGERVCFSGFRDKEMEKKLEEMGYVIVPSVTKETNILIVKDKTKSSSKIEKAKKQGIKIVEPHEILVS